MARHPPPARAPGRRAMRLMRLARDVRHGGHPLRARSFASGRRSLASFAHAGRDDRPRVVFLERSPHVRWEAQRPAFASAAVDGVVHPHLPLWLPEDASDEPGPSRGGEDEPDRDEDGLYIGTYSNFFTDPDQIKGVVIFSAFLAAFGSLGNIGASILLPILYGQPIQTCVQGILFGYYCPP